MDAQAVPGASQVGRGKLGQRDKSSAGDAQDLHLSTTEN